MKKLQFFCSQLFYYSSLELKVQNMCESEYVLMNKKVRNISLIEETA